MVLDIDDQKIEFACPRCGFFNIATIRQVRLSDVLICRGCKSNVQLSDYLATVAKARRELLHAVEEFQAAFTGMGKINLRI